MLKTLATVVAIASAALACAQVTKNLLTFDGGHNHEDVFTAAKVDSNGNLFLITASYDGGSTSYLDLKRFTINGQQTMSVHKAFPLGSSMNPNCVAFDQNGNTWFGMVDDNQGTFRCRVEKVSPTGQFLVEKILPYQTYYNDMLAIATDANNNLYVAERYALGPQTSRLELLKLSPTGAILSDRADTSIMPFVVAFDSGLNCIVGGNDADSVAPKGGTRCAMYNSSFTRQFTLAKDNLYDSGTNTTTKYFYNLRPGPTAAMPYLVSTTTVTSSSLLDEHYDVRALKPNGSTLWLSKSVPGRFYNLKTGSTNDIYVQYLEQGTYATRLARFTNTGQIYYDLKFPFSDFTPDGTSGAYIVTDTVTNDRFDVRKLGINGSLQLLVTGTAKPNVIQYSERILLNGASPTGAFVIGDANYASGTDGADTILELIRGIS